MSKESRVAIAQMDVYASALMLKFSGHAVLEELNENWIKGEHIETITETIETQIRLFNRQVDIVTQLAEKKDIEKLKSSLNVFEGYRKTLSKNLEFKQITLTVDVLMQYINSLNNAITTITALLEVLSEE